MNLDRSNRRNFLKASATLVAAATANMGLSAAHASPTAPSVPSSDIEGVSPAERASRIIREYDAQGIHRTGTEVDAASARWLAEHMQRIGIDTKLESFPVNRFDPGDAWLEVDGRRIGGVPLFDAGSTGPEGIAGHLGPLGGDNEIALIESSSTEIGAGLQARNSRHAGVVVITRGGRPGLSLINASTFLNPSGPPTLQVSSVEGEWLKAKAEKGVRVHLTIPATRTPTVAYNVVGHLPGRLREASAIGIVTPRSGWWTCASERGGGIVAWLETARALVATKPSRSVNFVATSGHELGQIGLDGFLSTRPGVAKNSLAWIHFGANTGAAGQANRVQAGDEELLAMAREALSAEGLAIDNLVPPGKAPGGEAHTIYKQQGRYISLVGDNPLFHQPADRWPEAIDAVRVARHAAAFARLAMTLASTP